MITVSNAWKQAMSNKIRDRIYISVGIGVINQDAQGSGTVNTDLAYWSKGNIFDNGQNNISYATMEENYFKADGTMYFMPENDGISQFKNNGLVTNGFLQPVRIDFPQFFGIKGITLDFGDAYPTQFTIETSEKTLNYTNDKAKFETNDVLGDTDYILITPISMVGGQQRFRLQSILMGVGLSYTNKNTKDMSLSEFVSSISEELPNENMSYTFYDENNNFNVDDDNSFIDYLETMQKITLSFGVTLEDKTVEWKQVATMYLKDWKSQKGIVSINATDRLSQMEDTYSLGNKIYTRTAGQEAENIFADAGIEPDEYFIDDYLYDLVLTNPMPELTHKECLQLLANACRCIIRQDEKGKIIIRANFATVLDPTDYEVTTNGVAEWSKPSNILIGTRIVYADMTKDFFKADGSMYFLPEDDDYLETSYVSSQISNENGLFEENPTITIKMPAAYSYYGINILFDGNPPKEMLVHTYNDDLLQQSVKFTDLSQNSALFYEFLSFDTMVLEFTKGYPQNRVLVNKISFGDLSDYVLTKTDMMTNPIGYKERRVKSVKCKVFTYQNDVEGKYLLLEDSVFAEKSINPVGETKTIQNPLISTMEHAELVAEWIGNYYANNVSYDVDYRGEPRINATDIIRMDSDVLSSLQVEIEKHDLRFNGGYLSGSLELRRALRLVGG